MTQIVKNKIKVTKHDLNYYDKCGNLNPSPFQRRCITDVEMFLYLLHQPVTDVPSNPIMNFKSVITFKSINYPVKDYWLLKPNVYHRLKAYNADYQMVNALRRKLYEQLKQALPVKVQWTDCYTGYELDFAPIKIMHPQQYVFNIDNVGSNFSSRCEYQPVLDVDTLLHKNHDIQNLITLLSQYIKMLAQASQALQDFFNLSK